MRQAAWAARTLSAVRALTPPPKEGEHAAGAGGARGAAVLIWKSTSMISLSSSIATSRTSTCKAGHPGGSAVKARRMLRVVSGKCLGGVSVGGRSAGGSLQTPRNEQNASTRASRGPLQRSVAPGREGGCSHRRPPTCAGPFLPLIGEARIAPAAVCSKRARTAVRLWRPIRSDLDVSMRAGALADARPPALQPERRGPPAVVVQRLREIAS